jgi:hypothetical protein
VQQEFYASYCQTPCNSNGADAFNISYELSTTIGLNASQYVLISLIDQIYPLDRVFVTPVTNEDWDLLVSTNIISNSLLTIKFVKLYLLLYKYYKMCNNVSGDNRKY